MLFDGKLDTVDLMAIEYEERQEKLQTIIEFVRRSPNSNTDISEVCRKLDIKLTGAELDWIADQIY